MIFFGSELTIRVGEEKNGIKIIAVEPPTNVRIGHMGGIYSVAVWAPTDMSKLNTAGNSSSSAIKFPTIRVPNANEKSAASEQAQAITQGITQGTIPASPIAPIAPAIPAQSSVDTNDEPNPDAPDAQREAPRSARPSSARSAAGGNASNQPQLPPPAATGTPEGSTLLPITPEQISAMSQGDVASALARVARARQSQGLDQATQDRLRSEFGLLRERQSSFYR